MFGTACTTCAIFGSVGLSYTESSELKHPSDIETNCQSCTLRTALWLFCGAGCPSGSFLAWGGSGDISSLSGVLCTTEDSIGVKYHTAEPNVQHDEAMQLITEHCVNGYVETKRVEYADSRTVYATCLRADGSPAVSQPCEFDADEQVGFGEEY